MSSLEVAGAGSGRRQGTRVGVRTGVGLPGVPSWPDVLLPQQKVCSVGVSAQACAPPTEIVWNTGSPTTATGTRLAAVADGPVPSWPRSLLPQHAANPPVESAQALVPPTETKPMSTPGASTR